ncbi:ScbR family autoregulator-binding transcription factor [Arthrobacter castelli]|uniref:ScbR family autoregulator-binding transcription factor n=1 Tax=Arthrobacter castelli TaxID=271431 RepID=UPI000561FC51|nr:ScbR family autoregulator-binding transcription factor [Arthrobacter castelli]
MVKQQRAHLTRQMIIRGAAEIFEKYGFGTASLQDILRTCGATKGSLYFHFSSKEDLAHAVIEEQHARSFESRQEVSRSSASALETMIAMSRRFGEQLQTDPIVRAGIRLTLEASNFERPVISPYTAWMSEYEALIRVGIERGEINDSVDPQDLARFIIPAFTGVQMVSEILTGRSDVVQRIEDMWKFLLPCLKTGQCT